MLLVRDAHLAILRELEQAGAIETPSMLRSSPPPSAEFGCLCCQKHFKSRAGEGAHMFRCHEELSRLRWLFDQTSCPACLREYHSFSRLKAHLRACDSCRLTLLARPALPHAAAGAGSIADNELENKLNGLLPPLMGLVLVAHQYSSRSATIQCGALCRDYRDLAPELG